MEKQKKQELKKKAESFFGISCNVRELSGSMKGYLAIYPAKDKQTGEWPNFNFDKLQEFKKEFPNELDSKIFATEKQHLITPSRLDIYVAKL